MLTVTANGTVNDGFYGTKTFKYTINKRELTNTDTSKFDATLTDPVINDKYAPYDNNNQITPGVLLAWSLNDTNVTGFPLAITSAGTNEFQLEYGNNNKIGSTGTVSIIAKNNNFTGSIDKTFAIRGNKPGDLTVTLKKDTDYQYDNGNEIKPEVLVNGDEVNTTWYKVSYSDNVNTKRYSGKNPTVTVEDKETGATGSVTFNMTPVGLTGVVKFAEGYNPSYTGGEIEPDVGENKDCWLEDNNGNIIKDDQYTIEFSNNINATSDTSKAEATAKASDTGNYSSITATGVFSIAPANLADTFVYNSENKVVVYPSGENDPEPAHGGDPARADPFCSLRDPYRSEGSVRR